MRIFQLRRHAMLLLICLTFVIAPIATAQDGQAAVDKAQCEQPALILLDYSLPVMDGPQVLEQLAASSSTQNIPVIIVTGISETDIATQRNGTVGFVAKPFDYEVLLDKITGVLGASV